MATTKIKRDEIVCPACNNIKKANGKNFFKSYAPSDINELVSLCKPCVIELFDNLIKDGLTHRGATIALCKKLDKPFIEEVYESAKDKYAKSSSFIGNFFRLVHMSQWRKQGVYVFDDSIYDEDDNVDNRKINDILNSTDSDIKITEDLIRKWGKYDSPDSYYQLEKFYRDMKRANNIETPQDENYLKKIAVISIKIDEELESGNYDKVTKLGNLYSKFMADSGFRAMDKTEADKTGGVRNFSTIYKEVEKDGFIPPWEYYRKLKGVKQDIVDKTIMHIENFTLKLNKIDSMVEPPFDTPKIEPDEIDGGLNDII